MRHLMNWLGCADKGGRTAILAQLKRSAEDTEFAAQASALEAPLYTRSRSHTSGRMDAAWSGQRFSHLAAKAGKRSLTRISSRTASDGTLASLNPAGTDCH